MKGLVIAVCCLVALAVAEEEKLAEMSVQPLVSSGALGGQPLFGGSGTVSYFFSSFTLNQIWMHPLNGSYLRLQ